MSLCHRGRQSNKARHSWWLCFLGVSGVSYHWIYPRSFVSTVHSKGIGGKVPLSLVFVRIVCWCVHAWFIH